MITYLKLDAMSESHRISAYKFEKLQTKCEFQSGKTLYSSFKGLTTLFEDVEKNIQEIKEVNQFVIPEMIRYRFPNLYNINIFTEIKKLANEERQIVYELNNVYNLLSDISYKDASTNTLYVHDMSLYHEYIHRKDALIHDYIRHRDKFLTIDKMLTYEMDEYIESVMNPYWMYVLCCFHCGKRKKKSKPIEDLSSVKIHKPLRLLHERPMNGPMIHIPYDEYEEAQYVKPATVVSQQKKPAPLVRATTLTSLEDIVEEKTAAPENRMYIKYHKETGSKKSSRNVTDEEDYINNYGL
jgi:hypothetical protein